MKLSAVLAFALTAFAQQAPSALPKIKFTDTRLDNGLRVVISEDHYAPVYAIAVAYKVGSKDERPGRTGFAHLFEHMMFKGSENVGMGELDSDHLALAGRERKNPVCPQPTENQKPLQLALRGYFFELAYQCR